MQNRPVARNVRITGEIYNFLYLLLPLFTVSLIFLLIDLRSTDEDPLMKTLDLYRGIHYYEWIVDHSRSSHRNSFDYPTLD